MMIPVAEVKCQHHGCSKHTITPTSLTHSLQAKKNNLSLSNCQPSRYCFFYLTTRAYKTNTMPANELQKFEKQLRYHTFQRPSSKMNTKSSVLALVYLMLLLATIATASTLDSLLHRAKRCSGLHGTCHSSTDCCPSYGCCCTGGCSAPSILHGCCGTGK